MRSSVWIHMVVASLLGGEVLCSASVQAQQEVAVDRKSIVWSAEVERELARPVTIHVDRVSRSRALDIAAAVAHVQVQYQAEMVDADGISITLHATKMSLGVVIDRVLAGTSLRLAMLPGNRLAVVRGSAGGGRAPARQGIIVGRITDAKTKQPLRGVKVGMDHVDQVVESREDGTYRILAVSAGSHTVSVKLLGYTRVVRTVMVGDDAAVTVDVALEPSATSLDQVVVTGTVIPTELKAVPNAITVITAKQIEERGITKIDQLFRGDVPGLFAMNQGSNSPGIGDVVMFSRGASALSVYSVGTSNNTNPIKTYVDGVELASSYYLAQIDPKSIERIEIITGPQASTIYGSNAINGVMQIFTKRGTTPRPQLNLNLMNGWIQNNFSSALAPKHDYDLQLTGVEGRISYNAGGAWNYTGAWTPSQQTANTSAYGGVRLEFPTSAGRVTTDLSFRRSNTQSRARGDVLQGFTAVQESGLYTGSDAVGVTPPRTVALAGQTWGLTTAYSPTAWWSHELRIGEDVSDLEQQTTGKVYATSSDTSFHIYNNSSDRHSLAYNTTALIPLTRLARMTLTVGGDASRTLGVTWGAAPPKSLLGDLYYGGISLYRTRDHNTGGFLQGQLGVVEHLFLTYGVRAEFNPAVGDKAKVIPGRYGAAYTQEFGALTAKLRASYGRSIRPPDPTQKLGAMEYVPFLVPIYGAHYMQLPNPELLPEYQQGGEGGLELYLGSRGSVVITRYNQTVEGLIDRVPKADSIRSLAPNPTLFGHQCAEFYDADNGRYCSSQDADGYWYAAQKEYLNIGSIRNQGWELNGTLNLGPLTTRGTYSWTKSRVIGITPKYRASFAASDYPQYRPGAPFQYLPEHTWAWGATYTSAHSTLGVDISGIGRALINSNQFYKQNLDSEIRLPQNQFIVSDSRYAYVNVRSGYASANLTASHRVSTRLDGVLQVQNLLDQYHNDYDVYYATMGRLTTLGLRLHL